MSQPLPVSKKSAEPRPKKSYVVLILMIFMALGVVIFFNYLTTKIGQKRSNRLPMITLLEKDFEGLERSGKTVRFSELQGKILIIGHVFTRCPQGCAGVASAMSELRQEFAADADNIQFISLSIDPEHDTPQVLTDWAKKFNADYPNWWFMTGDKKTLSHYVSKQIKFNAIQEIEPAKGDQPPVIYHDLRLALVDAKANVRGYYEVASADPETANLYKDLLRKGIRQLLQDQKDQRKP